MRIETPNMQRLRPEPTIYLLRPDSDTDSDSDSAPDSRSAILSCASTCVWCQKQRRSPKTAAAGAVVLENRLPKPMKPPKPPTTHHATPLGGWYSYVSDVFGRPAQMPDNLALARSSRRFPPPTSFFWQFRVIAGARGIPVLGGRRPRSNTVAFCGMDRKSAVRPTTINLPTLLSTLIIVMGYNSYMVKCFIIC